MKKASKLSSSGQYSFINEMPTSPHGRRSQQSLGSTQAVREHLASVEKQHTFYPCQFHQIIPEQINEESHRLVPMTTAKFMHEEGSRDRRHDEEKQSTTERLRNLFFSYVPIQEGTMQESASQK